MKRKAIIYISFLVIFCILIFLRNYIQENKRYDSPRESFERSAAVGAGLDTLLEQDGVAMVLFHDGDGASQCAFIGKNEKGWSSMKKDYPSKKELFLEEEGGIMDYRIIEGKHVVTALFRSQEKPQLSDDLHTDWKISSVPLLDTTAHFIFGVIKTEDFASYELSVNGKKYRFE